MNLSSGRIQLKIHQAAVICNLSIQTMNNLHDSATEMNHVIH